MQSDALINLKNHQGQPLFVVHWQLAVLLKGCIRFQKKQDLKWHQKINSMIDPKML